LTVSTAQLTRTEAKQALSNVINYPLFVPDLGHQVTHALVSGDLSFFIDEVERLSALGSRSASALLAYLYMRGAVGVTNLDQAESLCSDAAHSGDPYSQYVMGWICRSAGRDAEAIDWLRKAASKGQFLPAIVDIARFMAGGVGVEAADVRAALAVLWDAHKLGHRMALVYISELLRGKSGNWISKVLGAVLYPIAIVRATKFTNRYPLSDLIFVTSLPMNHPLFKIQGLHKRRCNLS